MSFVTTATGTIVASDGRMWSRKRRVGPAEMVTTLARLAFEARR